MKVLLITTEPSGDKLGANLIDGLRNEFGSSREIDLQGIGGPLMQERGLLPLFDYEDLSVMGFSVAFQPPFLRVLFLCSIIKLIEMLYLLSIETIR